MKHYIPILLAAAGLLAACASVPAPNQELTLARAAIDVAAEADAQRYASRELTSARRNLSRAEQAVQREENLVASRLAEQARADAELAAAISRAAQAEQAAQAVEQSIQSLREESLRGYGDEQ
ncbi:MAG: DUF4398 domain-containing protein [Gammaproteobacteria bacterium]|nr:DUF4398 domain-containing protein [Gammaproteobacteria bacterium]